MNTVSGHHLNVHAEVLNAVPENDESRRLLVDELKARGNAAFKLKNLIEADILYSKAIEHDPDNHSLYSNRSAAKLQMGSSEGALQDAEKAVEISPKWAKGHFRIGQVYNLEKKYADAYEAFKKALQMDPADKSAKKFMLEAKDAADKAGQVADSSKRKITGSGASGKAVSRLADSVNSSKSDVVIDEEVDEKIGNARGYKKLDDGRVTTYFNNEITEEARTLIGDIKPKKIEDVDAVKIKAVEGGSAWNEGSSFEQKDVTSWAKEKLKSLLRDLTCHAPSIGSTVEVNKVTDINGDACLAVVRGKKRYIYYLQFILEVRLSSGTKGKLKMVDMSSDCNDGYEVEVNVANRHQPEQAKLYAQLNNPTSEFRSLLRSRLEVFVAELHTM